MKDLVTARIELHPLNDEEATAMLETARCEGEDPTEMDIEEATGSLANPSTVRGHTRFSGPRSGLRHASAVRTVANCSEPGGAEVSREHAHRQLRFPAGIGAIRIEDHLPWPRGTLLRDFPESVEPFAATHAPLQPLGEWRRVAAAHEVWGAALTAPRSLRVAGASARTTAYAALSRRHVSEWDRMGRQAHCGTGSSTEGRMS